MKRDAAHSWLPFAILAGFWVILTLFTVQTWGWTYWDFGDGNYMYIARRVREGVVLYKDILAPQPPLHTLSGMMAQWFGEAIGASSLIGVRVFCLLVRMAQSLMVLLVGWRLFSCPFRGIAAAGIYLLMPIGFWWTLGYQSENLENVFLLIAVFLMMSFSPRQLLIAGIASALAAQCNMTAMAYMLANVAFLAFRRPRLLVPYLGAFLGVYTATTIAANIWTHGAFFGNVVLNQTGTFPPNVLEYAWHKITRESANVIAIEWGYLGLMLAGVVYTLRAFPATLDESDPKPRQRWLRAEYMIWTLIGMVLSICFTAKGGTVDYIFVLGEPGVAVFAGAGLLWLWKAFPGGGDNAPRLSIRNTAPFLRVLAPAVATALAFLTGVMYIHNYILQDDPAQSELSEHRAHELQNFILTYADKGDTILAPPFYAFATDTVVAGELAENYIWNIKYMNEMRDGTPGEATAKMHEVAELLRAGEVKVVLLDLNQTGQVEEIRAAIAANYKPAMDKPYQTRNTPLGLYIRKDEKVRHLPLE